MTRLEGAHVLVTGGSSGIGFAVAHRALERGARVSLVARGAETLAAAESELEARVGDPALVAAASADVADPDAVTTAFGLLTAQLGPVDVLVTCAGYAQPGHFEQLALEVFEDQMRVDYFGTLHAVRAVVPTMIERRSGHLLLVSSAAGLVGVFGYSGYCPAKFAVRGLAEALRPELKPHGVVVGCAYPPDTDTPGLERENEHKPEATKRISAAVKVRTADRVARAMIRGIERDRLTVTADAATALLARAAGALGPVVRSTMDRHVRRARRDSSGRSPENPRR